MIYIVWKVFSKSCKKSLIVLSGVEFLSPEQFRFFIIPRSFEEVDAEEVCEFDWDVF